MNSIIGKWYESNKGGVDALAKTLWENPELGHSEFYACKTNAEYLRSHGFDVTTFNARGDDAPDTAIVARFGSGHPVIGIYGEYDALPGLGQDSVPYRSERDGCGHGCGHNLMAASCSSAAVAAKAAMEAEDLQGTIIYIGCPAEEGGAGKMYMLRDGWFDELDCLLGWHPRSNDLSVQEKLQMTLAHVIIEFRGVSAHAAVNPESGRSALDACELMNIGVQYLREHCTDDVRIHYSYLSAGEKPNVVPAYAALDYYCRSKSLESCHDLVERIRKIANGAAQMTETECTFTIECMHSGCQPLVGFNSFLYESALKIPPLEYTDEEKEYAVELCKNVTGKICDKEDVLAHNLAEPTGKFFFASGSTDVGCVTYKIPTARIYGLGVAKGVPMHHWGVVATTGNSIGFKAAQYAGKALAQCAYDLFKEPEHIAGFRKELDERLKGAYTEQVFPPKHS